MGGGGNKGVREWTVCKLKLRNGCKLKDRKRERAMGPPLHGLRRPHQVSRWPVSVLVQNVPRPLLSERSVPLRDERSHPNRVSRLNGVPLVPQSVDALALQQEQPVLVVVHLLHIQKLSGLKVHDVNVEVVGLLLGKALFQLEDLARCDQVLRARVEGGGGEPRGSNPSAKGIQSERERRRESASAAMGEGRSAIVARNSPASPTCFRGRKRGRRGWRKSAASRKRRAWRGPS